MIKMRSLTPVPSWVQALGRVWRRFYAIATSTSQPPVPQYMASDGDGRPWASFWPAANPNAPSPLVVFGHDAKRRLQKYPGALGIDTGCLYGNGLTAWCSPENKLYEVASRCVHVQPGKKYVPPPPVEIIPQPVGLERKVEPNVGVAVAAATSTSTVAGRAA